MEPIFYITSTCSIQQSMLLLNGSMCYGGNNEPLSEFLKGAFKSLGISYSKFYKMDNLSKLAFLGAEYILPQQPHQEAVALVFSNRSGSLDTDVKHQQSIQDPANFYPSPAIFVYTLANICTGEVSIRHGLQSENIFFVSATFDAVTTWNYTQYLLQSGKADKVLCGWVELFEEQYKAVFYLVEKEGQLVHSIEHINQLFKD
ncbi:hypothetical protein ACL9RF_08390 [Sphingobacterium sp. Mn56C]|uniref:hypothetical protein n=1 Tax=Sphingobacterium sp. Mn56C TaxID=3395261 RepID=UPI003BD40DD9